MEFKEIFDQYNWEDVKQSIYSKTTQDVIIALQKSKISLNLKNSQDTNNSIREVFI